MGKQGNKVQHSRLIKLLSRLSKNEFKELRAFVHSPFHNRNAKVIELFKVLENYYPLFKAKELDRNMLHKRIFPESPFND